MPQFDADTSWFNITLQSGDFGVYAFEGVEEVCKPYEFLIELVSLSSSVDCTALLGTPVCLTIADRSGEERIVHGIIHAMEQLHTANRYTHYRCAVVPRLWFLDQIRDHRIFQNLSVVEIIQKILKEQGFTAEDTSFKLFFSYTPRDYCVQYGETDLHFITRLCEEEGIYFYFEHRKDGHTLCFCDREGGPKIPGENDLRFYPGSGHPADTAVISRLNLHARVNSNAAAYREWNFQKPRLSLEVKDKESDRQAAPTPPNMLLEQYTYSHLYQLRDPGDRYVKLQLSRQLTFRQWIECESDVSRWLPSYTFTVHDHPHDVVNAGWWVVAVRHEGKQPGVLEHEAPDERGLEYKSRVTAIPEMTRFIPALEHPKTRVIGDQTAIVTGPEGEEIYPDRYGRVKVQFHWDREGRYDENTTCWIRVSQGWAGAQYGGMAIPRIGHEVIVAFLEGDPDRPVITGRVYHELNMPPYALPEHKTRMTIRSKTHKGEGYNELRFEDMKGNEQVYLHGQRDVDIIAEHDRREWIKNDRHLLVEHDRVEEITGISSSQAGGDRMEGTGGKRTLTVGGDEARQVGGSHHMKVNGNVYIEGMTEGVLEMHQELTIKAPGGFIRIDGSGITIEGKVVNINGGGSAGTGFPVQAVPARTAVAADSREAGSGRTSDKAHAEPAGVTRSGPSAEEPFSTFGNSSYGVEPVSGFSTASSPPSDLPADIAPACGGIVSGMQKAPTQVEQLKISEEPFAQEWRKTVADARQEATLAGKMDIVDRHFQRSVSITPENAQTVRGPYEVLTAGNGSSAERAVAEYHTLHAAGVPADSMRVMTTGETTLLLGQEGTQTLVSGTSGGTNVPLTRDTTTLSPGTAPVAGVDAERVFTYSAHPTPCKG